MATIKTLNPTHNQFEPLNMSMKKSKIALGKRWGKRTFPFLNFVLCALNFVSVRLLTKHQAPSTKLKMGCSYSCVSLTIRSF